MSSKVKLEESWGRGSYRLACPNCGGTITEDRLARGLPCERCLAKPPENPTIENIYEALRKEGKLKEPYKKLYELEVTFKSFVSFFEEVVGSKPWGAQRAWMKRLVRGDSFSIIAPTGVGKTTFGLVAALFYACKKGSKSYIVLPTTTLVVQAYDKIELFKAAGGKGCSNIRILAIHSKMGTKARNEAMERIKSGDFDILISTSAFMRKNVNVLNKIDFKLVFADDVDAVLRSGKSVDAILKVVGFSDEDIEKGLELLKILREQASLVASLQRVSGERKEKLKGRLIDLEIRARELRREISKRREKVSRLVVSSATGRPRGARVRLFRTLLNFEAGGRSDIGLRNVIDTYIKPKNCIEDEVVRLVKKLKGGILIFVPIDIGIEGAERLAERLKEEGINAEAYHSKKSINILEEFSKGNLPVLVGVANYYGTLVRGLDLPKVVKYAIFAGVPRHKFGMDIGEPHPARLLRLLSLLSELDVKEIAEEARVHLANMRKLLRRLSPIALQVIAERVLEGEVEGIGSPVRIVWEAYNFLRNALADKEVWDKLSKREDIAVIEEDGKLYVLIPDPATYVQASGRTSRLYAGGITKGLSIVVVDDERVFKGLVEKVRWITEAKWVPLKNLNLDDIIKEIEEDRRKVGKILSGKFEEKDLVKTALLVVESPNKARTIANFFGQPSIRILSGGLRAFEVATGDYILTIAASGGHVYDLVEDEIKETDVPESMKPYVKKKVFGVIVLDKDGERTYHPVYTSIKRCLTCGHQFTADTDRCPRCGGTLIKNSRNVVEDLRRLAWEADIVLIGTDPDTEGEKIGWDIALLLRPYSKSIMRLEFHEVTRRAIREALRNLRDFNQKLVDAQIVRRIEDRWIGFTLSPWLWCDFWPNYYCRGDIVKVAGRDRERCETSTYFYNLSAGRVQTPTLGWIVERSDEAKKKVYLFTLWINSARITFREDDENIVDRKGLKDLKGLGGKKGQGEFTVKVKVEKIEEKEDNLNPLPPYTTDDLIADANRFLGLGAPETMALAQNLFEWGLITYHRTDSTRVSDRGIQVAKEWMEQKFKEKAKELFKPRTWGKGGAHEAIRPVRPLDAETLSRLIEEGLVEIPGKLTKRHLRLYDLIFRRFMSSQMREAKVIKATYRISIEPYSQTFVVLKVKDRIVAVGSRLKKNREIDVEAGFFNVWGRFFRVEEPIPEGTFEAKVTFRKVGKKPLFTQGEIVEEMKKRGIGRPSTYAKIIDTLFKRAYVTKVKVERRQERVVATSRGKAVYKYLTEYLKDADKIIYGDLAEKLRRISTLVSEERTRILEEAMDNIEEGKKTRVSVLNEIYSEIAELADAVVEAIENVSKGGLKAPEKELLARFRECIKGFLEREGGDNKKWMSD